MKKVFFLLVISWSLSVNAQNYLISFAGTGLSSTVNTVKVENLTTGTTLNLNGGDILQLTITVGISPIENTLASNLKIYPNPMTESSTLQINPPAAGNATITLSDMNGKQVAQIQSYLENCLQELRLSGLKNGFYLISVKGSSYQYSGKLLCNGKSSGTIRIEKIRPAQVTGDKIKETDSKGVQATIDMPYTNGDRLKFTGTSGIYTTTITDIPASDKTITFNFVSCTDFDNYNYPVVQIGTQMWMAENLKSTHYSDGAAIDLVTGDLNWNALTILSKAYCWNNDDLLNKDIYGALYTWAAAMNGAASSTHTPSGVQGACPTGWNIPSDADWYMLENYLVLNGYNYDGTTIAPNRLGKALAAVTGWDFSNAYPGSIGNTDYPAKRNATGFSALPGGMRFSGGSFLSVGRYARWWTATEYDATNAYNRYTNTDYDHLSSDNYSKVSGYSVRCVKY
jgi:uncharacterized protein (TIGR02145 family)